MIKERRPKSKRHPLNTRNFVTKLTFSWLHEALWVARRGAWTEDMNYDLPEFDKVDTHGEVFKEAFNNVNGTKNPKMRIKRQQDSKSKPKSKRDQPKKNVKFFGQILTHFRMKIITYVFVGAVLRALYFSAFLAYQSVYELFETNIVYRNKTILFPLIVYLSYIIIVTLFTDVFDNLLMFRSSRLGLAIRSGTLSILNTKVLKLKAKNLNSHSSGFIMDLCQVDVPKISEYVLQLYLIIQNLTVVVVGAFYMWTITTHMLVLVTLGTTIGINLLYFVVLAVKMKVAKEMLIAKDKRMFVFNTISRFIGYIKTNGFEKFFCLQMFEKREREVFWLKQQALVQSFFGLFEFLPMFAGLSAVIYYIMRTNARLDYSNFLTFIQISNLVSENLTLMINRLGYFAILKVSLKRLEGYLKVEERDVSRFIKKASYYGTTDLAVKIQRGYFRWGFTKSHQETMEALADDTLTRPRYQTTRSKAGTGNDSKKMFAKAVRDEGEEEKKADEDDDNQSKEEIDFKAFESDQRREKLLDTDTDVDFDYFELNDINVEIPKGDLVLVLGRSGSGKTSLLACMTGEMLEFNNASLMINGPVSYLDQDLWVLNSTIRENITLGRAYDKKLMTEALKYSDFDGDIKAMDSGINTVVGNSGDGISSSQRAKMILARCFYQKYDSFP